MAPQVGDPGRRGGAANRNMARSTRLASDPSHPTRKPARTVRVTTHPSRDPSESRTIRVMARLRRRGRRAPAGAATRMARLAGGPRQRHRARHARRLGIGPQGGRDVTPAGRDVTPAGRDVTLAGRARPAPSPTPEGVAAPTQAAALEREGGVRAPPRPAAASPWLLLCPAQHQLVSISRAAHRHSSHTRANSFRRTTLSLDRQLSAQFSLRSPAAQSWPDPARRAPLNGQQGIALGVRMLSVRPPRPCSSRPVAGPNSARILHEP